MSADNSCSVGKKEFPFDRLYFQVSLGGCNLRCEGCFTHVHEAPGEETIWEERTQIMDFGAKHFPKGAITFSSLGEPLMDRDFWKILDYIRQKGLKSFVYTNAALVKNVERARTLLSNGDVLAKRNTMDDTLQNQLVGKPGASQKMMQGLQLLMEARRQLLADGQACGLLGVQSYVVRPNRDHIADVLRFCRKNDLTPDFTSFITLGQKDPELIQRMLLPEEDFRATLEELQRIDKEEFGIETRLYPQSAIYDRRNCKKATKIAVKEDGNIYPCIIRVSPDDIVGNIYADGRSVEDNLLDAMQKIQAGKINQGCCICKPVKT